MGSFRPLFCCLAPLQNGSRCAAGGIPGDSDRLHSEPLLIYSLKHIFVEHFLRVGHRDTAVNKTDVVLPFLELAFCVTRITA